jgi:conjugative relaxase-like TrwC/TraI family protein
VISLSPGYDPGYLTDTVGGGREGYYTGAVVSGEPAGLWYGRGAESLGLRGEVDPQVMSAMYAHLLDPRDPRVHNRAEWGEAAMLGAGFRVYRTPEEIYAAALEREPDAGPERRAELRANAGKSAKQNVAFVDATFSAPKSVSVLGAAFERMANLARAEGDEVAAKAWEAHHRAVEDAVLAGARAGIDYLQDVAGFSREGHHGGGSGRWIDAHDWTVAQFLQHDSREHDPHLHVHSAILNRVLCSDGRWRALDTGAIWTYRAAASAIAARTMEARITAAFGGRFEARPDGNGRELVGVDRALCDELSSRRRAITPKIGEITEAFRSRYGREPHGSVGGHGRGDDGRGVGADRAGCGGGWAGVAAGGAVLPVGCD